MRVLDGITPENIIEPPRCTAVQFIVNNPTEAVRATIDGLFERWEEVGRYTAIWFSLTAISQWVMENLYDGIQRQMSGATRACLIRRGLVQPDGGITLLGRHVVHHGRDSHRIWRRINCRRRALYPEQAALLGLPPGCCTALYHDPPECLCECHELRRVTPRSLTSAP